MTRKYSSSEILQTVSHRRIQLFATYKDSAPSAMKDMHHTLHARTVTLFFSRQIGTKLSHPESAVKDHIKDLEQFYKSTKMEIVRVSWTKIMQHKCVNDADFMINY